MLCYQCRKSHSGDKTFIIFTMGYPIRERWHLYIDSAFSSLKMYWWKYLVKIIVNHCHAEYIFGLLQCIICFLAATKQLYEWYFLSVRLSVCPSVTPFWLCSHHRIIMKFSGVITKDKGKVHAKGQGQRSKVKVTEVTTPLNRFRCFSRSYVKFQGHTALKIVKFHPNWAFPDCNSSLNSPMATKWCMKLEVE